MARRLAARYGFRSSQATERHAAGPVRQALGIMANAYRAATDDRQRAAVVADGDRLLQASRQVGFLPGSHTRFSDFARAGKPARQAPASAAPTPPAPAAPPAQGVLPADTGLRVAGPLVSRLEPFGARGSVWVGTRLREGPGVPPPDWKALPTAAYSEIGAGVSATAGAAFDPSIAADALGALTPRIRAYFDTGTPNARFRAEASVQAATNDPAGRRAADVQLSGARRSPDGGISRGAVRVGTPPPIPGARPAVDVLLEHRQPVPGLPAPLRGRLTFNRTGAPGEQTFGAAFGMPGPDRGTFPAAGPGRPVVDLAATWQQAPGTSSTTVAATVGYAAPSTVATAMVTRRQTQSGDSTTTLSFAAQQRLQGRVGDPNTSTATPAVAAGIDPQGVPTGRFPAGAKEPITTLYADGSVTLQRSTPAAAPGEALGPDRVRVGVVHNRPQGHVPTLYAEVYGDLTPYPGGQSPRHGRLGGEIGIRLRPVVDQPVTVDAALRAGAPGPRDAHGGAAVRLGVTVELDKDTAVQGGVQIPLNSQDDPEVYVRLTRRF